VPQNGLLPFSRLCCLIASLLLAIGCAQTTPKPEQLAQKSASKNTLPTPTAPQTLASKPTPPRQQLPSIPAPNLQTGQRFPESKQAEIQHVQYTVPTTEIPVTPLITPRGPTILREELPPVVDGQRQIVRVPGADADALNRIQLTRQQDRISLTTRDAPIAVVLGMIAEQHGLNIVAAQEVTQKITVSLNNVRLEDALNAILAVNGYTWSRQQDILLVTAISATNKTLPTVQGRTVRVFTLNYILATEAERVVKGLLSPVGQSFISSTNDKDQRQAFEQLVVEDLPSYVDRVAAYLAQVDVMPRQVLVEANILQVTLKDNCKHGVNFDQLIRYNNTNINLTSVGFASGTGPASVMTVAGGDLTSLIDLLQSTTDAKTLATPKVAVLNGQEARMQVGGKLGYFLTTTTQTSTLQSVDFLEYGVILKVTPIISEDGQVLMKVFPQVSTGRINPVTKLPESETTEVETKVMLADGQAIVIGGLIKESDNDSQNKIPWLGDLWLIGRLFQNRDALRERNEIIVTLTPRIVSAPGNCAVHNPAELDRVHTRLIDPALNRMDRTMWEPQLPDASQRKYHHGVPSGPTLSPVPESVPVAPMPIEQVPTPAPVNNLPPAVPLSSQPPVIPRPSTQATPAVMPASATINPSVTNPAVNAPQGFVLPPINTTPIQQSNYSRPIGPQNNNVFFAPPPVER
jgi:type IV pilus assembly protein PilQ